VDLDYPWDLYINWKKSLKILTNENDLWPFFIRLFFKKRSLLKKTILLTVMLTIVNEESSLTIVNETANFIKTVIFWKTIVLENNVMQIYWMSSYMKWKSCGGARTSWYFLKNSLMLSKDALQVGFLSSLTKRRVLKKLSFFKTIVFVFDFSSHFYNETIVFQKKENVNIPRCMISWYRILNMLDFMIQNSKYVWYHDTE